MGHLGDDGRLLGDDLRLLGDDLRLLERSGTCFLRGSSPRSLQSSPRTFKWGMIIPQNPPIIPRLCKGLKLSHYRGREAEKS